MSLKELYQGTSDNVLNVVYLNHKVFMSDIECQYQTFLLRRIKLKILVKKFQDYIYSKPNKKRKTFTLLVK